MRARILVGLSATIVLAACGPTASPTASSRGASPPPPTPVAVPSCRIPVAADASGGNQMAGFITLPAGTYQDDPGARMAFDTGRTRIYTVQTPVLYGDAGATWDAAFHRWLPVQRAQVLPDGSAYVYTVEGSTPPLKNEIHLVTVASGADHVVYNAQPFDAIAFTTDGIYLTFHQQGTDGSRGLYLLDPSNGKVRTFENGRSAWWDAIAEGGAWSYSVDGNIYGSSSLSRLDLATDTVATWFSVASPQPPAPGYKTVKVVAFDAGQHPIALVSADGGTPELDLLSAPNHASKLTGLPISAFSPQLGEVDQYGTWIAGADGLYLYTSAGFEKVAPNPSGWDAHYQITGPCT